MAGSLHFLRPQYLHFIGSLAFARMALHAQHRQHVISGIFFAFGGLAGSGVDSLPGGVSSPDADDL